MKTDKDNVIKALKHVIEPDLKQDIVKLEFVKNIEIENNVIKTEVMVKNPAMHNRKRMKEACIHQLERFLGDGFQYKVSVIAAPAEPEQETRQILQGVKNIIAIASGKGGVGKSTITANIAAGLANRGFSVGIIDADIYGPSMPIMFGVQDKKPGIVDEEDKNLMLPVIGYDVKIMSIGFFAGSDQAVAWRGPMASKALSQLFSDVQWGNLDYLFIDLPPGTGDIHLTLVQGTPLTGAIVVSTPQSVALADARKSIAMFKMPSIEIPIIGIVENMAWFSPEELPDNKYYIFGNGGAKALSKETGIPLLGQVPLIQSIRESGDTGKPLITQQDNIQSHEFENLLDNVLKNIPAQNPIGEKD